MFFDRLFREQCPRGFPDVRCTSNVAWGFNSLHPGYKTDDAEVNYGYPLPEGEAGQSMACVHANVWQTNEFIDPVRYLAG